MEQAHRNRLSARSSQVPGGQFIISSLPAECLIVSFKRFSFIAVPVSQSFFLKRGGNEFSWQTQMVLLLGHQ